MIKRFLLACLFLTPLFVHAESLTTDNLILNGNFESGNLNNWTTEGNVKVFNQVKQRTRTHTKDPVSHTKKETSKQNGNKNKN